MAEVKVAGNRISCVHVFVGLFLFGMFWSTVSGNLQCTIFNKKAETFSSTLIEKVVQDFEKFVSLGDLNMQDITLKNGIIKEFGEIRTESLDLVTCGPGDHILLKFTVVLESIQAVYIYTNQNSTATVTFGVPYVKGHLVVEEGDEKNATDGYFEVTESLETKTFLENADKSEDSKEALIDIAVKSSERGIGLLLRTGIQPVITTIVQDFLKSCSPTCLRGNIVIYA